MENKLGDFLQLFGNHEGRYFFGHVLRFVHKYDRYIYILLYIYLYLYICIYVEVMCMDKCIIAGLFRDRNTTRSEI